MLSALLLSAIGASGIRWPFDGFGLISSLLALAFLAAGLVWIVLLVAELRVGADASAVLLVLWMAGTFVFSVFVNWSLNGRTLLPMVPACGLLFARRLRPGSLKAGRGWLLAAFGGAAALALAPAWADYRLANSSRLMVTRILSACRDRTGELWFQGHWGFQYYMEQAGAKPLDLLRSSLKPGDRVVIPRNNTNVRPMDESWLGVVQVLTDTPTSWLTTMNPGTGASFYSDIWGPLPYALGRGDPEQYAILPIMREVNLKDTARALNQAEGP